MIQFFVRPCACEWKRSSRRRFHHCPWFGLCYFLPAVNSIWPLQKRQSSHVCFKAPPWWHIVTLTKVLISRNLFHLWTLHKIVLCALLRSMSISIKGWQGVISNFMVLPQRELVDVCCAPGLRPLGVAGLDSSQQALDLRIKTSPGTYTHVNTTSSQACKWNS